MRRLWLMLIISIILINCLIFSQAYRGKRKIKGFVYDEEGNPIEGVRIKLFSIKAEDGFETVTDKKGKWKALWIRGGSWNIDFEKEGFESKKISLGVKEFQNIPDIEIKMKKAEGMSISDDLKVLLDEGNRLYEQEKYKEAIEMYKKILQINPKGYIIYLNIGNSFYKIDKYKEAIESYKKVLEQDADNPAALIAIGNSYLILDQRDEAMKWYDRVKFEEIKDAIVLYNIGNSFYENSRLEEALKYYLKAVEIKRDFLEASYQLGLTLTALAKYEEALKGFEEYLKYDSESSKASQVKGFIDYLKKEIAKKKEKK